MNTENNKTFYTYLNSLRQKGNLVYEYNPFHNYQTEQTLYLVDNVFIVPKGCVVDTNNGEILNLLEEGKWKDKRGKIITENDFGNNYKKAESGTVYAQAGSIIDLDTEQLNFDLEHPVDIEIQPSYDGSVNLILNDNKNIPRLINSRFSVREKNTYEIVDRIGENDTNIYNSKYFNNDTSLYYQYTTIPTISFEELIDGQFPVGQYCFYITYCDSDGNESDIVSESNLIPLFIGGEGIPFSMDGGIKNERSNKGVLLKVSNLDTSYSFIKIKYIRYFADYQQNRVFEGKEIIKKYEISNYENIYVSITGYEETLDFDPNIININRFNPKSILTQAQCKNMLFFGNITKITDNYKELSDLSLRIVPNIKIETLEQPNNNYSGSEGYYNPQNMYYKVGYFDQEYYSFGIVYIYNNGTLSNVYPTMGYSITGKNSTEIIENIPGIYSDESIENVLLVRDYIEVDNEGWIKENSLKQFSNIYLNSKGVCKIDLRDDYSSSDIISIEFNIPDEVSKYLSENLGINGYFFVRQKCVPNIIAQCYLMPFDEELKAPILETKEETTSKYYSECFVSQRKTTTEKWPVPQLLKGLSDRSYIEKTTTIFEPKKITHNYDVRLREYDDSWSPSGKCYVGICPDFLLNQPYYNQIFNSSDFRIQQVSNNSSLFRDGRFWKEKEDVKYTHGKTSNTVTICSVTEDVPSVVIKDKTFKLKKGQTEEAVRFEYVQYDSGEYSAGSGEEDKASESTNISRGMYSPFLAIYSDQKLETSQLYNIYSSTQLNTRQEISNRLKSSEPYYAISDRVELLSGQKNSIQCFRGDCFVNTFTYRLNRNFNDPSLPNNDVIVDENTWADNYSAVNSDNWNNIILSDLNAIKIGSWITFKCRSAQNYALRSVDHSYVSEEALMGAPRSFYPKSSLLEKGENKMPDSYLYNDAYRATLGYKCYFKLLDINYIKDSFLNRIQYSAISIQDSFKNNYRVSLSTYFRDYSQEYGSIQKLVGFEGYLLVIFEHAIGVAVINERVLAGSGDGEPVFINTKNVLPEELTIITDTYGTQWPESVIKSEAGYVYGVDTIAKKIWRVKGQQLEILSDFKVNKFLIENISLGEREHYPIIGLKNVKTHYNNNKKDIMFTFYDDIYQNEEKVWNLCYNELLEQFITFYSWIPSYSENIDTQFFTFNRNTSKWLTLLGKCNYRIPENTGIVVDIPVLNDYNSEAVLYYRATTNSAESIVTIKNQDGTTYEKEVTVDAPEFIEIANKQDFKNDNIINTSFKLEKDHWGNWRYVDKDALAENKIKFTENIFSKENPVITLLITPMIDIQNIVTGLTESTQFPTETIAFTLKNIVNNQFLTQNEKQLPNLTTDFYLHGKAGIFNVKENLYPTHWYGEYHPFEFEFVVNDKIGQQKIFNNLVIISNKAEPESFHFEIEGDNYEFSSDKRTMYFRQEATKELYQNLGSNMMFDRNYSDVLSDNYTHEQYYRGNPIRRNESNLENSLEYVNQYLKFDKTYPINSQGLVQQVKSTIFPLYYQRVDTYNEIYHHYIEMTGNNYDFKNLSGSEIKWDRDLNQFNIVTHIKNSPIDLVGRLRGNSRYKEGKWNVQIPSIIFNQKNETDWKLLQQNNNKFILNQSRLNSGDVLSSNNYRYQTDDSLALPPIIVNSSNIPNDLQEFYVSNDKVPNIYSKYGYNAVKVDGWTYRKEARIRDKWIKIRVRYSGKNLAVIHSLITLYNVSYS